MRTTAGAIAILLLGCGDNLGVAFDAPTTDGPTTTDGPPTADAPVDAATADAAIDAAADASPPGAGTYVVSTAQVPTTSGEAQTFGMDIDSGQPGGDPGVDNQLGAVLAALSSMGFDVQGTVTIGIDQGLSIDLLWYDTATEELHTYVGANPNPPACSGPGDVVCRHHLDGTATFDVAAGEPTGVMPTTTVGSTTTGGPGTAVVQVLTLGTTAMTLPLIGARFQGTIDTDGITMSRLAGAVPDTVIQTEIIPAFADGLNVIVQTDCPAPTPPACNCAPGSQGQTILATFDDNNDCTLSAAELANNSLVQALLMPDVTIDGVDALSLGFLFTAVTGTFTP